MDLMEQIRQEATKYADNFEGNGPDAKAVARHDFVAGAQALLNLLGRSATSEGHPPRVWIHTLDRKSVVPVHALIHFDPEHEHHEYLSRQEHEALRAADLLEVEKLREELKFLQAENEVFGIAAEKHGDLSCCYDAEDVCGVVKNAFEELEEELSQEREARKGDSAELELLKKYNDISKEGWRYEIERNARLTAALKEISNFYLHEDGRIGGRAKEIASEALSEAGKDFSGDRRLPSVWIDPNKLARYPEVPAWPAHKHKENEHLIEYVPISRLRSEE